MKSIRQRHLFLHFLVIIYGAMSFEGCSSASTPPPATPSMEEDAPDSTLGAGDVFDVRVYGEDELSKIFRVASDGSIDFPLLGTVSVSGMTPTEVSNLLEDGLRGGQYIKNPQVSIFVKEYKSKKVSVLGQVKKPGTFPYEDGMSIVEAVSIAGGFTSMARENDTTVTRIIDGKKKRFHVLVESITEGRETNFYLQPGDIIFVPERVF